MVRDLMHLLSDQAVVWTDAAWGKMARGTTVSSLCNVLPVLTAVYTDRIQDGSMMVGTCGHLLSVMHYKSIKSLLHSSSYRTGT